MVLNGNQFQEDRSADIHSGIASFGALTSAVSGAVGGVAHVIPNSKKVTDRGGEPSGDELGKLSEAGGAEEAAGAGTFAEEAAAAAIVL